MLASKSTSGRRRPRRGQAQVPNRLFRRAERNSRFGSLPRQKAPGDAGRLPGAWGGHAGRRLAARVHGRRDARTALRVACAEPGGAGPGIGGAPRVPGGEERSGLARAQTRDRGGAAACAQRLPLLRAAARVVGWPRASAPRTRVPRCVCVRRTPRASHAALSRCQRARCRPAAPRPRPSLPVRLLHPCSGAGAAWC